jgi:hypothetical protein
LGTVRLLLAAAALLLPVVAGFATAASAQTGGGRGFLGRGTPAQGSGPIVRSRQAEALDTSQLLRGQSLDLRLDLFEDAVFDAELDPAPPPAPGYEHWNGTLAGVPLSAVTVTRRGGDVSASVTAPGVSYQIRNAGPGVHMVEEIDQSAFPDTADDAPVPPTATAGTTTNTPAPTPDATPEADTTDVIRILVAYTPQARTAAGGAEAITNLAAHSVSITSDAFADTGITAVAELAGVVPLNANVPVNTTGLEQVKNPDDGVVDGIHEIRDNENVRADLVAVLAAGALDNCGIGYRKSALSGQADFGFSVSHYTCASSTFTFIHEVGHNFGAHHDRYAVQARGQGANSLFPYGYGYVNGTKRWYTVVAYDDQCDAFGVECTRLPFFSTPAFTYNGDPLGIPSGQSNAADNSTAINTSAPYVAAYRK